MLRKLTALLTSFILLFALVIKDASALPKSPFLGLKDESSALTAHSFLKGKHPLLNELHPSSSSFEIQGFSGRSILPTHAPKLSFAESYTDSFAFGAAVISALIIAFGPPLFYGVGPHLSDCFESHPIVTGITALWTPAINIGFKEIPLAITSIASLILSGIALKIDNRGLAIASDVAYRSSSILTIMTYFSTQF